MIIIGYIHICQVGNWHKGFDMVMDSVKSNGLYDATLEIRVCVVNNSGAVIDDIRFHDEKIVLVEHGPAGNYERTTLVHMATLSETDPYCQYWYAHTKGIRAFTGPNCDQHVVNCVTGWIKLMTHWNFVNWRIASEKLQIYDTYGCEYHDNGMFPKHYSGNFWWATSKYIEGLPKTIGGGYYDPEFWLLQKKNVRAYNVFSTGHGPGALYLVNYSIQ